MAHEENSGLVISWMYVAAGEKGVALGGEREDWPGVKGRGTHEENSGLVSWI